MASWWRLIALSLNSTETVGSWERRAAKAVGATTARSWPRAAVNAIGSRQPGARSWERQLVRLDWMGGGGSWAERVFLSSGIGDPDAPNAPVISLLASSDSGTLGDSITSDTTPSIRVDYDSSVVENDTIQMYVDGALQAPVTILAADITAGFKDVTLATLANGMRVIIARITHATHQSTLSNSLSLQIDNVAPTITSASTATVNENAVLAHALSANEEVAWTKTGGADTARFEISGSTLRWLGNGVKDFEAPDDADLNNTYVVQVTATDLAGNVTNQTITVTVLNVFEGAGPTVNAERWMETPDILAYSVDDAPLTLGNTTATYQDESAQPYGNWVLRTNSLTGQSERCQVIGKAKNKLRFTDKPPTFYVDHVKLADATKYSITGGTGLTVTAVYYRNDQIDQGIRWTTSQSLILRMRRTFLLKLSSVPTPGIEYTVSHADGAINPFTFTFNEKTTRAGGLKASMAGHRYDDKHKKAYLCARLPGGPANGVVDFVASYGMTTASIIDEAGTVVGGPFTLTLRRAWNQPDVGAGHDTGIDVADLSQSWTVTGITVAATPTVQCPGHPFVTGDKVRFHGIAGMTQIEGVGTAAQEWVANTVTVIDANSFSINRSTVGFSAFTTTPLYSTALGGVSNQVHKCFNTNRAATSVWEIDYTAWSAPVAGANYRLWIPGYGVSDPFVESNTRWQSVAGVLHEGVYNLRLGCDVNRSPGYTRPAALVDGANFANYHSRLPAIFSSEDAQKLSPTGGPAAPNSGWGAYAEGSGTGPGYITNVRATASRAAVQDAADNDDILHNHVTAYRFLALVLNELPVESCYDSFTVQTSSSIFGSTLFPASSDNLPPAFHELFFYMECWRLLQFANGGMPGGLGVGHMSSQVADYPEPIQDYRGTNAGGTLAGQIVDGFYYAEDHATDMAWASSAAQCAILAYKHGLTALGDAYKTSALDAYARGDALIKSFSVMDSYYNGELSLQSKTGWTFAQFTEMMMTLTSRALTQKYAAVTTIYRMLGSTAGQPTYGQFIDSVCLNTVSAIVSGGSGYVVGDILTFSGADPIILRVSTVAAGAITAVGIVNRGSFVTGSFPANPQAPVSATGVGSGASFNFTNLTTYGLIDSGPRIGCYNYYKTPGHNATVGNYFLSRAYVGNISSFPAFCLSSETCFNHMIQPANSSGGTTLASADQAVIAQLTKVFQNGIEASRNENFIKSLQAGFGFSLGANMPGKSFLAGLGPRSYKLHMHEDTRKMALASPRGILAYGYFAWGSGNVVNNFAGTVNGDGSLNWLSDNTSGLWESEPTPGSKKVSQPWRKGTGYWEWAPEGFGLIFQSEYDLRALVNEYVAALYLHGWDGNANELSIVLTWLSDANDLDPQFEVNYHNGEPAVGDVVTLSIYTDAALSNLYSSASDTLAAGELGTILALPGITTLLSGASYWAVATVQTASRTYRSNTISKTML